VVIAAAAIALSACGESASTPTASPAKSSPSTAPAAPRASAMIGGIGQNGRADPFLLVCQMRGTVPGMVFHGTLSGPNIGSTNFTVTAGQPSQGVAPISPTDGVFVIPFPGKGGQHGGGPLGPFTCTLTSVDVPSGLTLAPHSASDWTITVT
jgi:hypothetical protein